MEIRLEDNEGNLSNNPFYVYGRPRRALESTPRISDSTGYVKVNIKAFKPGKLQLSTRSISQKREDRIYGNMKVEVPNPPLDRIVFEEINPWAVNDMFYIDEKPYYLLRIPFQGWEW